MAEKPQKSSPKAPSKTTYPAPQRFGKSTTSHVAFSGEKQPPNDPDPTDPQSSRDVFQHDSPRHNTAADPQ